MATPRITKVFAAVNIGSFRVSAMIAGLSETGEMVVLGSGDGQLTLADPAQMPGLGRH